VSGQGGFDFDGDTYDPEWDQKRLGEQLTLVRAFLSASMGRYWTIEEIRSIGQINGNNHSINARFSDLRKRKGGMHTIDSRRRAGAPSGTWEYSMTGGPGTGQPIMRHCRCCPNYSGGDS